MPRLVRVLLVAMILAAGILGPLLLNSVLASGETGRGGLAWYRSFAEARSAARAQGKLILVASTRPGCGLCEAFRSQTAPACRDGLERVAVGYLYDITRPEDGSVDRTLRAHLPGARLMPLVGFVTPDLGWVHGFWGQRSVAEFQGDVALVARTRPAATFSAPPRAPTPAPRAVAPGRSVAGPSPAPAPRRPAPTPAAPPTPPAPAEPESADLCPGGRCGIPGAEPFGGGHDELCPGGVCGVPEVEAFSPQLPAPRAAPEPSAAWPEPGPTPGRVVARALGNCGVPPSDAPTPPTGPLPAPALRRLEAPAGSPRPPVASQTPPALAVTAPRPAWIPDTASARRALDSKLDGSPDGEVAQPVSRPAQPRAPTAPPPAPVQVEASALPPSARSASDSPALVGQAQEAARAGHWGEVVRLCQGSSDARLVSLSAQAQRWSQDELEHGLRLVLAGRHDEALRTLRGVEVEMAGEAAGADAVRGIDALHTMRDLRRLTDPAGPLATALKRNKYDELRGTRWARLFSAQG